MVDIEIKAAVAATAVVARAAHRYTDTCFVEIHSIPDGTRVKLTPRSEHCDAASLAARFHNDVLDEQLRSIVREETRELHIALVSAALRGANGAPGLKSQ